MATGLKSIDARTAAEMQEHGALLIDIREDGEYEIAHIPASQLIPLSRFEASELPVADGQAVVYFCASGNRTRINAARLIAKAPAADAYGMEGGITAWAQGGLPIE
jgi:rhodanese-related sulfurtransferase